MMIPIEDACENLTDGERATLAQANLKLMGAIADLRRVTFALEGRKRALEAEYLKGLAHRIESVKLLNVWSQPKRRRE